MTPRRENIRLRPCSGLRRLNLGARDSMVKRPRVCATVEMIATSEQISSMGKAVIRKVMHPSTKYPRASATLTSFIVPARPMNSVRLCSMVVRMDGASSLNPKKVASREKTMVTSWLWNT